MFDPHLTTFDLCICQVLVRREPFYLYAKTAAAVEREEKSGSAAGADCATGGKDGGRRWGRGRGQLRTNHKAGEGEDEAKSNGGDSAGGGGDVHNKSLPPWKRQQRRRVGSTGSGVCVMEADSADIRYTR